MNSMVSYTLNPEKKILNHDDAGIKYSLVDFTYLNVKKLNEQDTGIFSLNIRFHWQDECLAIKRAYRKRNFRKHY
jgi:hypothetical protein